MSPFDQQVAAHPESANRRQPAAAPEHAARRRDADCAVERWTVPDRDPAGVPVPRYLKEIYAWAYMRPGFVRLLDRPSIVSAILWGNYRRLLRAALFELRAGQHVYQPACVYGDFSCEVAKALGPQGHLYVGDVVPLQVENCRRKLGASRNASVHLWNATEPCPGSYDAVCCFFLLHEMPEPSKHEAVNAFLDALAPGGKAVFIDYHRPHWAHPLKLVMSLVFDTLEPFAKGLWDNEIASYARRSEEFEWSKQTFFGGLYQKVVARHRSRD